MGLGITSGYEITTHHIDPARKFESAAKKLPIADAGVPPGSNMSRLMICERRAVPG
jgi:hypothetical protein